MTDSKIEWTDKTWNPATGCTKVSQGCKHCYAEGIADRFFSKQYPPNADGTPRKFTDVRCHEDRLEQPLRWKKPCRIFVNSMSDLFHEDVPFEFIGKVFRVMLRAKQHTYQVLTKRPQIALDFSRWWIGGDDGAITALPANLWLGVSVEDQKTADERIPLLLQTPAAVRWVSYEPALGALDFSELVMGDGDHLDTLYNDGEDAGIDWLVCGGESGPAARSCNLEWLRSAVRQCKSAGVPCFVKQLGAHIFDMPTPALSVGVPRLTHSKGGDINEFPPDLRIREYPR